MKLSVLERLLLLSLLPKEGSFTNLKLVRLAREQLSFNEAENKLLQFQQVGEQATWKDTVIVHKDTGKVVEGGPLEIDEMVKQNPNAYENKPVVEPKEIKIGELVTEIIKKSLKELNEKEQLNEQHISLYEKFVDPGPGFPEAELVH